MKMEREEIGISGVDLMVQGGIPKGGIVGISGPPGIGKSIFILHYLLEGARKGEKCVYVNLEEPLKNIKNMVRQFDFSKEFFEFVEKKKIVIRCFDYEEYEKISEDLLIQLKESRDVKRLVIDSFNCFFSSSFSYENRELSNEGYIRKKIGHMIQQLRRDDLTTLLVLESQSKYIENLYNIPHLVDGMINLDFLDLGSIERRIFISKMRWTNQHKETKSFEIGEKGIILLEEEE